MCSLVYTTQALENHCVVLRGLSQANALLVKCCVRCWRLHVETCQWSYLIALRAEPATVPEAARNPSNCELRLVDSSERTLYWVTSVEEATCLGARHTVRAV